MEQYPDKQLEDALKTVRTLLPFRHECLACYVFRMLAQGCDGLKWSRTYRDMRAPRATALERKFPELGGYCDCEVMANVFHPVEAMWELDESGEIDETCVPQCREVRLGTIRPCALWAMRRGVQWGGGVYRRPAKVS